MGYWTQTSMGPQTPLYRNPTHPSSSRLGEHHWCQRPNRRVIPRLQQGLWHCAPQTTANEITTLRYWWQDQQMDCFSTAWPSTKSDRQWNWLGLVTSALRRPSGHSDRYNTILLLHHWHHLRHHECDSLLTTALSTGKSAALTTTTSCKTASPNSSHGLKDGRWHSIQKSATSSRSPASVTSVNLCTTSTT